MPPPLDFEYVNWTTDIDIAQQKKGFDTRRTVTPKMPDRFYSRVFQILSELRSMPFLELASMFDVDDERMEEVVRKLEKEGKVKISNRGNIVEEIITLD